MSKIQKKGLRNIYTLTVERKQELLREQELMTVDLHRVASRWSKKALNEYLDGIEAELRHYKRPSLNEQEEKMGIWITDDELKRNATTNTKPSEPEMRSIREDFPIVYE